MAGITVTLSQWDKLLQEDYVNQEIVSAIDTSTVFKDRLKRNGMTHGRRRIYPVKVGASQGQGARAEGANMPQYGAGEYQDVIVDSRYNYAPFKVTGQSLEFSTKAAFVEFGMQLLEDTKEGMALYTGRQCWGDGTGRLGLVNNGAGYAAGSATIAVDSPYGVSWGSFATNTTFLFRRNMLIQFGNVVNDNGGAGYTITAVGATSITISPVTAGAAVPDNTAIYILGSANLEIEGWLKIVGSATFMTAELALASSIYHGIDRASFPEWEGNVINGGNAALTLAMVRQAKSTIFKRTNDQQTDLCIGSSEAIDKFESLLQANVRYVPATTLRSGYTVLSHDGLDFTKDAKAPVNALNFVHTKSIAWAQTKDPHWLQDSNGIMRVVAGQDALEGLLKWYSNLDAEQPRRQCILYNTNMQ